MSFWRAAPGAVLVQVKVQPKSRRPGVQGRAPAAGGERLRVGVSEAAEGGRANRAACAALACVLGVPQSAVEVAAGATSRDKVLRVSGDPVRLASSLERL
jgi:uncharacterized protein YggU (UPF0235/DUF167 family)